MYHCGKNTSPFIRYELRLSCMWFGRAAWGGAKKLCPDDRRDDIRREKKLYIQVGKEGSGVEKSHGFRGGGGGSWIASSRMLKKNRVETGLQKD